MVENNPEQAPVKEQNTGPQEVNSEPECELEDRSDTGAVRQDEAAVEEKAVDDLATRLAEAEEKAAEYLDGWQRSRAEFANFRRRQEQLQQAMRQQALTRLMERLINVLDDQERAFNAIPEEMMNHSWIEGLTMVGKKLLTILEKEGLSVMQVCPGDDFDPYYHQALLHEPSAEYDEGQIVEILQKGYNLGEMVLRPAVVRVSSGKVDQQ